MADDIQVDEPADIAGTVAVKPKKAAPVWMVITVLLSFGCMVAALTLQYMEYQYYRGGIASDTDAYAAPVLIPAS